MPHPILAPKKNATQIKQPGIIVAFEELGGFENIGEERVLQIMGGMNSNARIRISYKR